MHADPTSIHPPSPPQEVADLQQAILRELRKGRVFVRLHKEGGTMIRFDGQRFVRQDHGDYSQTQGFDSEVAFLAHVRDLHDHEIACRDEPGPLTETQAWRLIHGWLQSPGWTPWAGASLGTRLGLAVAFVAACALSFGSACAIAGSGAS